MTPCAHHWVMESHQVVKLSKEQLLKHPNCVGRNGTCKKCGESRVIIEKLWEQSWAV